MTPSVQSSALPRLLIVDDDADYVDSLSELLHMISGWTVDGACSLGEGLCKAQAHCPDAVLMDMELNGESGFEVLDKLRQALPAGRVCFVAVTGSSGLQWQAQHDARFTDAFLKPVDSSVVLSVLSHLLSQRSALRNLQ